MKVEMEEELFKKIHAVLSALPYGQIQPLMVEIIQGVSKVEEDAETDERSE